MALPFLSPLADVTSRPVFENGTPAAPSRYDSGRSLEVPRAMSLLTVRAAAERMGIGYSTLKQWIHQGKVRTTQTAGGHHRLSESEVERMMARHSLSSGDRARPARTST